MSYGNGINVASGFDLGAKSPLDSRNVAETIAERDENVTNNRAYDGMIVYVKENKTTYQYVNNEWIIFGSNTSNDNVYTKEEINEIKRILEEKDIELSQKIDQINEYLANSGGSGGSGIGVFIGENPPIDTNMIWIDSTTPYNLNPNNYEDRLKNNYIMMLNNSYNKITSIEEGLMTLQNAISKITNPENNQKIEDFNIELNSLIENSNLLKNKLTNSKLSIINNKISPSLKSDAKKTRKEVKSFIYSLYDLKHRIMQVIDSERITIVIPEEPSKPPITTVDNCLLTEDGFTLLTEDGLMLIVDKDTTQQLTAPNILTELGLNILTEDGLLILADGMDEVTFTDAILTELGLNILTEDGKVLLADGIKDNNSTEILTNAILTELGLVLTTEDNKQILKG